MDTQCIQPVWTTRIDNYQSSCNITCDYCYHSCKTCSKAGISGKHDCTICLDSYIYYYEYQDNGNKKSCYNLPCESVAYKYHDIKMIIIAMNLVLQDIMLFQVNIFAIQLVI